MSKLQEERYRLIWSLALEDQVVDRWLYGRFVDMEIDHCLEVTSKTGWNPLPDGFKAFWRSFPKEVETLATDCSMFDWTYPAWLVYWVMLTYVCQLSWKPDGYMRAFWTRISEVMGPRCVVRLPNGEEFIQQRWGVMKSGFLLTLSMNSRGQFILCGVALRLEIGKSLLEFWAMGDDMIMQMIVGMNIEAFVARLNKLGVKVKQWSHEREFAGFKFRYPSVVNPAYPVKHQFLLGSKGADQDLIDALSLVYALAEGKFAEWIQRRQKWSTDVTRAWALGLYQLDTTFAEKWFPRW